MDGKVFPVFISTFQFINALRDIPTIMNTCNKITDKYKHKNGIQGSVNKDQRCEGRLCLLFPS
jgi:hypothetical protein